MSLMSCDVEWVSAVCVSCPGPGLDVARRGKALLPWGHHVSRVEPELLLQAPQGWWYEEIRFVSVRHDCWKGKGESHCRWLCSS